jgi:hypothetical protein
MKPQVDIAQLDSLRDDGEWLAIAGFVIGGGWALAALCAFGGAGWEPQGLIVKQWLGSGFLTAAYVAILLIPKSAAGQRLYRSAWIGVAHFVALLRIKQRFSATRVRMLSYVAGFVWLLTNLDVAILGDSLMKSEILLLDVVFIGLPIAVGTGGRAVLARVLRRAGQFIWANTGVVIRLILSSVTLATAIWLVVTGHRQVAFVLGTLTTLALRRLARVQCDTILAIVSLWSSSVCVWALALGYTYTPLDQWMLSALPVTGLAAIAFTLSFALVLQELAATTVPVSMTHSRFRAGWLLALFVFAELGLRTDGLVGDFIAYHRSYWVSPAEFIRSGAWPLWDYPTQYGVLSALSLAAWPSLSIWQALYYQTALFLVIQASIIFFLFSFRRNGWANLLFATCFAASVVDSCQGARAPFGLRLYPQLGLRFQWLVMILMIGLFIYFNRDHRFRRWLGFVFGYAVWTVSIAWSFESGVFTGVAWVAFVVLDVFGEVVRPGGSWRSLFRLAPLVAIPLILFGALELIYRVHFGHGPDWLSYFEFSAVYQQSGSGLVRETPNVRGALWALVIMLVTVTSVAVASIRRGRYDDLPVLGACWAGIWITSVYFVGETFEDHVSGLAAVFGAVIGTIFALDRSSRGFRFIPLSTKVAFAPLMILVLAYSFGSLGTANKLRAPLIGGSLDSTADFPPIHGELLGLFKRAGVRSSDEMILPTSDEAVKFDTGMMLPFVRGRDGRLMEQMSWLPMSPVGPFSTLFTLPYERRQTYLERYFHDVGQTGWLVGYRRDANCGALIRGLRSVKMMNSENYRIARCLGPRSQEAMSRRSNGIRTRLGEDH